MRPRCQPWIQKLGGGKIVPSLTNSFANSGQDSRVKSHDASDEKPVAPYGPHHEPGLTPPNSEPRSSPTAYPLNAHSWDR
jgi:hypothetical protein